MFIHGRFVLLQKNDLVKKPLAKKSFHHNFLCKNFFYSFAWQWEFCLKHLFERVPFSILLTLDECNKFYKYNFCKNVFLKRMGKKLKNVASWETPLCHKTIWWWASQFVITFAFTHLLWWIHFIFSNILCSNKRVKKEFCKSHVRVVNFTGSCIFEGHKHKVWKMIFINKPPKMSCCLTEHEFKQIFDSFCETIAK